MALLARSIETFAKKLNFSVSTRIFGLLFPNAYKSYRIGLITLKCTFILVFYFIIYKLLIFLNSYFSQVLHPHPNWSHPQIRSRGGRITPKSLELVWPFSLINLEVVQPLQKLKRVYFLFLSLIYILIFITFLLCFICFSKQKVDER